MNNNRTLLILALVIMILLNLHSWYKNSKLPVEYLVCGEGYADCFVSAHFGNMRACQDANEKGGWLCDTSNPKDIKCQVPEQSSAVGYCRE